MSDPVLVERDGPVATVTLNLPEKRNALTMELRLALLQALERLSEDGGCRAIVLTGAGGAFCAGGDISAMRGGDPLAARRRLGIVHAIVRLLVAGPKPVVAAVEGAAFGAGMSLAVAADVVVAGEGARFCASFGRIGLMPDAGLLWTLPQRVGLGDAKRMMMEGVVVGADEAHRIGLADQLTAAGTALGTAMERARSLAAQAPVALALIRAALARAPAEFETMLAIEADGQALLFSTNDHAEGRDAFLAKRPPRFKGA